jgi:ABC-2 type transport system permease protein
MIAGTALAFVAVAVVIAVSAVTGGAFSLSSNVSLPVVVLALVALTTCWMVVGFVVTALVRDTRYASIVTVSLALVAYFLTGYNGGDPGAFQGPTTY